MTRRLETFTEANAWVHLSPDRFRRYFPCVRAIWQAEAGPVWVESDSASALDESDLAWWEVAS